MTFKEELKVIRKVEGLSQKEMAYKLKIPYRTYINWELGLRTPPDYVQACVKILAQEK